MKYHKNFIIMKEVFSKINFIKFNSIDLFKVILKVQ